MASTTATSSSYTEIDSSTTVAPPSSESSPFLRRLDSFRRSSTEFTIANLKATYGISVPGTSSSSNNLAAAAAANPVLTTDYDTDSDPQLLSDPLAIRASTSSESQAIYGNEDIIKELRPDYARWFYKYEADRSWTSFTGYDSIRVRISH